MRALILAVLIACHHDPAPPSPQTIRVAVIGGMVETGFWGTASDGEARDTWSLRELVKRIGPTARVGDTRKAIDQTAWNDPTRVPILHTTKRGALKFRWADGAGRWGETEIKDVTRLEIVR